ncbi:hypothetical protein [Rubinisphaera brasiliensis]|uniref:Uncharacterized protein n=1 Tax=Rubinisphaera brasiliensis (strain ATCC 49424 / DSM 5305 / JCM 21570 / IAM 15109 / NBRC 103401 / IFAM 1448) TaxID=756272 RepID=F0SNM1_RUBBR|nr:hypothetical protein [Rubinisphaera brasiliensis]ADY57855.1 hypothetical protein Plabr_0226 [Rubinisphaera brasiliensis DSM 5305]
MADYSDEYKWWDQTESVTLTLKTTDGDEVQCIERAKRTGVNNRETVFQGVSLYGTEQFWLIPSALVDDNRVVHEGDTITDEDGAVSTIQAVQLVRKGSSKSHYRCLCSERET